MRVVGVACMKRTPARNYTGSKWRQTILGSMDCDSRDSTSEGVTGRKLLNEERLSGP